MLWRHEITMRTLNEFHFIKRRKTMLLKREIQGIKGCQASRRGGWWEGLWTTTCGLPQMSAFAFERQMYTVYQFHCLVIQPFLLCLHPSPAPTGVGEYLSHSSRRWWLCLGKKDEEASCSLLTPFPHLLQRACRPWEKGLPGPQFSRNVEVWRHRIGAGEQRLALCPSCPPLPHRSAWGGGSIPWTLRQQVLSEGSPGPSLCPARGSGGMSPGSLLTLRTVRPHQPLTRTLSPRPLAPPCVPLARVTTCLWTQLRLLILFPHRTSAPQGWAFSCPAQSCVPKPGAAPGA